jgi:hypothetical protein
MIWNPLHSLAPERAGFGLLAQVSSRAVRFVSLAAPALCRNAASLVGALPGQPRRRSGALRQAVPSDVVVISCQVRSRVPGGRDDGVSDTARSVGVLPITRE